MLSGHGEQPPAKKFRKARGGQKDREGNQRYLEFKETGKWPEKRATGQGHVPFEHRTGSWKVPNYMLPDHLRRFPGTASSSSNARDSDASSLTIAAKDAVNWAALAQDQECLVSLCDNEYVRAKVDCIEDVAFKVCAMQPRFEGVQSELGMTENEMHACLLYLGRT